MVGKESRSGPVSAKIVAAFLKHRELHAPEDFGVEFLDLLF
jgi:hypothetical protein